MKNLLFILFLCSNLIAAPECYKGYAGAVDKVNSLYKKAQYRYSLAYKDQYIYEIFPTTMFPFFCLPADTVKKLLPCGTVYLCNTTIGLHLDKSGQKHIQIAVLQYTTVGNNAPGIKSYILYFFKFDSDTKAWIEDRGTLTIVFTRNKDGSYRTK